MSTSSPSACTTARKTNCCSLACALAVPSSPPTLDQLERDHEHGERAIRDLEHALLAFEVLGEPRREAFEHAVQGYVEFYLRHMAIEESEILPAARRSLDAADWAAIDAAFVANRDPLTGHEPDDAVPALVLAHRQPRASPGRPGIARWRAPTLRADA